MGSRVSWVFALGQFCLITACFGSHGNHVLPSEVADAGRDAGRSSERDSSVPLPDAGSLMSPIDAGPPASSCDEYLMGRRSETCSVSDFGRCSHTIAGVPCCTRDVYCDDGVVVDETSCTDDCAQSCELVEDASDCEAFRCEWFVGGCGPAPEGFIGGPRCIRRRGSSCAEDSDCEAGQRCQDFWIDPCAGAACDACGGEARFCL